MLFGKGDFPAFDIAVCIQNTRCQKYCHFPVFIFEIDLYEGLALGFLRGVKAGKALHRTGRYFRSIRSRDPGQILV